MKNICMYFTGKLKRTKSVIFIGISMYLSLLKTNIKMTATFNSEKNVHHGDSKNGCFFFWGGGGGSEC